MAPQFMAFLFKPSVHGLSLRYDLGPRRHPHPAADAAIALVIAASGGSAPCDPITLAAADVNHDGQVTSLDALMILQGWLGDTPNHRKTINTLEKVRRKLI